MKRTLFSVTLVAFAAAIAGVEEGDGVPQPPPSEWSARNDALTRAQVFRDMTFDAATVDFTVDPNRALVDAALAGHALKLRVLRTSRRHAEVHVICNDL